MASNYNISYNATTDNYPSPNVSIWTVPTDSTVSSEKLILVPNNNQSVTPSAPEIGDLPPDDFDISIVPNDTILYNNDVTPYTTPSQAEIKRKKKGVLSIDSLIDKDPDQLWLYFMTYLNEKPQLKVNICGFFVTSVTTMQTCTDSQGRTHSQPVTTYTRVEEFNFSIDLAPYISDKWWRIVVIPSSKSINRGEYVSLRDAIEEYTLSNKKFKDIVLQKQYHGWNLSDLEKEILQLVRSTGYQNSVNITFPKANYEIAARSSSQLSVLAHSNMVRFLCCITCLCIIFGPIYCCLRAKSSTQDKIVADYIMMESPDHFLQLHSQMIVNAVKSRSKDSFLASFALDNQQY